MELSIDRKGRCTILLLERWQETTEKEYVEKWDLKVETEALIIIFTVNLGLANDLEWNKFTLCGLYYGVGQNGIKPKLTVIITWKNLSAIIVGYKQVYSSKRCILRIVCLLHLLNLFLHLLILVLVNY